MSMVLLLCTRYAYECSFSFEAQQAVLLVSYEYEYLASLLIVEVYAWQVLLILLYWYNSAILISVRVL